MKSFGNPDHYMPEVFSRLRAACKGKDLGAFRTWVGEKGLNDREVNFHGVPDELIEAVGADLKTAWDLAKSGDFDSAESYVMEAEKRWSEARSPKRSREE